jgi:signal transduction histidine kinase
LLVRGPRVWPGILLGAILGNVALHPERALGPGLFLSSCIGLGNTLEAVTALFLLRRWTNSRDPLARASDVLRFVAVALLACLVCPTIGGLGLWLGGATPWELLQTIWFRWWLGHVTGVVVVTPLLLTWKELASFPRRHRHAVKTVIVIALLVLAGQLFGGNKVLPGYPRAFMLMPIIIWTAFQFGRSGVALVSLLVSIVVVWATTRGVGQFVGGPLTETLLLLQAFIGTVTVTGLVLATLLDELYGTRNTLASHAGKLEAANRELEQAAQLRIRLLQQVLAAREEEQRRIARDLHDGVGQSLTSLRLGLRAVEEATTLEAARAGVAQLRAIALAVHQEVRQLVHGLRPSVLDDLGLTPALERIAEEYTRSHELAVTVEAADLPTRPPVAVETALFRIAQEALTNVVKHAQAKTVRITLEALPAAVRMTVIDDGCGFHRPGARDSKDGLGLVGMRERAALLQGSVEIQSLPARGSRVQATIPLGETP